MTILLGLQPREVPGRRLEAPLVGLLIQLSVALHQSFKVFQGYQLSLFGPL